MTADILDEFRREVSWQLACGSLAEYELPVTADDGAAPVVAALEDELLSTVLGRLRNVGGFANLFVRGADGGVRVASVVDERCSIPVADDDLTSEGQRPCAGATVGMFLDYVGQNPNGVKVSAAVGHPARARDTKSVEFAGKA
jgi:hypothetical protein